MIADFYMHVPGFFTVGVCITYYQPGYGPTFHDPGIDDAAEFVLLNEKDQRLVWLENKLTPEAERYIERRCIAHKKKIGGIYYA